MPLDARDRDILKHILRYCEQTDEAHAVFAHSREQFAESSVYRNAVCMCVLQIGELVGQLSDDFKSKNDRIPWRRIRGMRNFVAHEYGKLDMDAVWFTATKSVQELKAFCEDTLTGE